MVFPLRTSDMTTLDDAMKKTPQEIKITQRMQPGVLTLNGFLGEDKRDFPQIIEDDAKTLETLGVSAEEVGNRLDYFQKQSFESFQGPIIIDEIYEVETDVVRGFLPCPFMHRGLLRKAITTVKNLKSGKSFRYTAMNVHMIRAHGFFEGKGSKFRLEPEEVVKELLL